MSNQKCEGASPFFDTAFLTRISEFFQILFYSSLFSFMLNKTFLPPTLREGGKFFFSNDYAYHQSFILTMLNQLYKLCFFFIILIYFDLNPCTGCNIFNLLLYF